MLNLAAQKCDPIYPFRFWCLLDNKKEKGVPDKAVENPMLLEDTPEDNGLRFEMQKPQIITVFLTGCKEIPKVEVEIKVPKIDIGGGEVKIRVEPPAPTPTPKSSKPTIKPTSFSENADTPLTWGSAETLVETPINEGPIELPSIDDGGGILV